MLLIKNQASLPLSSLCQKIMEVAYSGSTYISQFSVLLLKYVFSLPKESYVCKIRV